MTDHATPEAERLMTAFSLGVAAAAHLADTMQDIEGEDIAEIAVANLPHRACLLLVLSELNYTTKLPEHCREVKDIIIADFEADPDTAAAAKAIVGSSHN